MINNKKKEIIKQILKKYKTINNFATSKEIKDNDLTREGVHKTLQPDSNTGLDTMFKILKSANIGIQVKCINEYPKIFGNYICCKKHGKILKAK